MIHPLTTNPTNTIGLCETDEYPAPFIGKSAYIGKFTPSLLEEWAKEIQANFGDCPVHITIYTADDKSITARCLAAGMEPDDVIKVCVSGWSNDEVFGNVG